VFTFPRTVVVPAFVFGLAIATVQGQALAANPTDTMSAEELADHQSQQIVQQEGQIVQPQPVNETQLASAARTLSAEEFADYQDSLNAVTIVTQTPAGSDD